MKKNRIKLKVVFIAVLTLCITFYTASAQNKTKKLDELIGLYTDYGQFNGSVLVAENGKVIYKKGFGMANMEWDIPNKPNTKFRLGSITKQFTAMLIAQMAAEGKLDLQKPISTYLPDYPKPTADNITTHHLLTHTSGIPNYTAFPNFFRDVSREPYTPKEFVAFFADSALQFTPGETFSYSNSGYFLLGYLIETISGKSYEEVLQERIFDPLKMNDTGYDHHDVILKNRAAAYEKNGNSYTNANYLDMSIPYAAGSMYSTVEDLYLWDQALYTNKLLPKKYMDMVFQKHIPTRGRHYGYGWSIETMAIGSSKDSVQIIGHGGGINGFNTLITRIPTEKSLVLLLNNTGGAPLYGMTVAINGILHNKPYGYPKKSVANSLYSSITEKGLEKALVHYSEIKASEEYELDEGEMNNIGYRLMGSGKMQEAEAVFKLNMEAFPESFNVYDSYAEALMNQDKNDLAIQYYKKSLEINPANQNGVNMLEKLGANVDEYVKEISISRTVLESYVGKYELMPGFIITVRKEGDQLKAQATGQPEADIFPKSENVFYLKVVAAELTFNRGDDESIASVTLNQGGRKITGKKID